MRFDLWYLIAACVLGAIFWMNSAPQMYLAVAMFGAVGFTWWVVRLLLMKLAFYKMNYDPSPLEERRALTVALRLMGSAVVIAASLFIWAAMTNPSWGYNLQFGSCVGLIAAAIVARLWLWDQCYINSDDIRHWRTA